MLRRWYRVRAVGAALANGVCGVCCYAFVLVQGGKFSEAQEHLDWLLCAIPLVVVGACCVSMCMCVWMARRSGVGTCVQRLHGALLRRAGTRSEANEVKELLGIVTEYKIAVHIEVTRKSLPQEDEPRQVRTAAVREGGEGIQRCPGVVVVCCCC